MEKLHSAASLVCLRPKTSLPSQVIGMDPVEPLNDKELGNGRGCGNYLRTYSAGVMSNSNNYRDEKQYILIGIRASIARGLRSVYVS